jgi:hypothetical protein
MIALPAMAARRVSGFLRHRQLAFEVAVERHAVAQEVMDAGAGFTRKAERDLFVDETCTDRNRVRRMGFRCVAFADGRRDAALRPGAGCAFAERRGRDDGDGTRAELQRTEQAGKAAADDDHVIDVAQRVA